MQYTQLVTSERGQRINKLSNSHSHLCLVVCPPRGDGLVYKVLLWKIIKMLREF